jgi:hypothetical protein
MIGSANPVIRLRKTQGTPNRLWLLINSEAWYRMFIDGNSRQDLAAQIKGTA